MSKKQALPRHLSKEAREWARGILKTYEIEPHQVRLVVLAAECSDRISQARERIAAEGAYFKDRFGCPKVHPALLEERNHRTVFARLLRELNLIEEGPESRPPGLKY